MIIVRLSGGMGNQMFQYAIGRSLAIKNNVPLGLDAAFLLDRTPRVNFTFRDFDLDVFNIQAELVSQSAVPFWPRKHLSGKIMLLKDKVRRILFPGKGTEKKFQFDSTIKDVGPNTYLEGYWQSPKYFFDIQDIIRADFTLKDGLSEKSLELQKEIKNANSVCVHVRRGDYVGNSYHDVGIGESYYEQGVQHILTKSAIDKIYVFSDDVEWCREHIYFGIETMFVGSEYAGKKGEEHLVLMTSCKHFLIANSSFSWWAAWLATNPQKIVIAPKKWFGDATIDTIDLIPEGWMRI